MKNLLRNCTWALAAGVVFAILIDAARAGENLSAADQSMITYNERVVKKLLETSDPDVALLARLKMMQAHIEAALQSTDRGDMVEAREHITHPSSEILPEIRSVLRARNLADPAALIVSAVQELDRGDLPKLNSALAAVNDQIVLAEASIDPSKMAIRGIIADTAVLLLRSAVAEYAVAFKYGKIVNIVEYHDGSAFVAKAVQLIRSAEPQWLAINEVAYQKLNQSLIELQSAWPGAVPPEQSILPLTRMLALVTIIELQINRIRAST